jgi:hypothetical protein
MQADIIKVLRDHNITHSLLSKTEMCTFMKLINRKMLSRYEEDSLDFQGFVHLMIQIGLFFHLKERFISPHETGGKGIHQLNFGEMIDNLITWFKLAAQARG